MGKHIRLLAMLLSAVMLVCCAAACGPAEQGGETSKNPDGFGGREIKFAVWGFDYDAMTKSEAGRNLLQRLKDLEKQFDCTINVRSLPKDTTFDAIYQAIAAGDSVCDLIDLPQPLTWVAPLKGGYLVDLKQYDLDLKSNSFDTGVMDMITYGDKVYGIATKDDNHFMNQVCYFNKRLVSEVGYNPDDLYKWQKDGSWNWDKFKEIAVKISRLSSGSKQIWGTVQNNYLLFNNLVVSNNTDWFKKTDDGVKFSAGDTHVLRAAEFMKELYDNGCFPQETSVADAKLFYGGSVGFLFDYVERVQWPDNQQSMTDDYGIVMIPKGPNAKDYYSMNNYYGVKSVLKNAKDPEKLAKLLYAFCQPYENTADLSVTRESYVRDEGSLDVFELLPARTVITPQALGSPVREDFQAAVVGQYLSGATTVMNIVDEMQLNYDNVLKETWNVPQ